MRLRLVGLLALLVAAEQAVLYPRVFIRGEVISDVALAYGMAPWRAHPPSAGTTLRGNPTLSDDMALFTPWDVAVREAAARREAPLWNPACGCGMPLLANDQSAVLGPTQLLRLAWDSPRARTWGLVLKPIVAAIGMALLLAHWRLAPAAAMVGGMAWANSAALTVWLLYPLSEVLAWFPWFLLGVSHLLGVGRSGSLRGGFLVVACGGAMLLAGHLPTAVQLLVASAAGVAVMMALRRETRRRAGALAGFGLLALGLAAPQVLPSAAYLGESHARLARGGASPSAASHLPASAAWSWLVPRGFGSPERAGYHGPINFNEATASVGAPALFLAVLALLLGPRRRELALAGAALISAAAAYGMPPLPWLLSHLPLLRWAAGQRWLVLTQWAVAGLAACGVHGLLERSRRRAMLATIVVGAALLALVSLHPAARSGDISAAGVLAAREVVFAAIGVLLTAAVIGLALLTRSRTGWHALAVLVLIAGGMLAWEFNPTIPPAAIPGATSESEAVDRLRQGGRILPVGWVMRPNTGLLAGLPTTTGFDDFIPQRYFQFTSAARLDALDAGEPLDAASATLLRRSATTMLVANHPLEGVGMEPVACCAPALWVARVAGAHPPAAWYPRALSAADAAQAFAILSRTRLVDEDTVLVEAGPLPLPHGPGLAAPLAMRREDASHIAVSCAQPREGILVVREAVDPGWRATLDGRPVPVLPTDGMFMGVLVPRGAHAVAFAYRPFGWRLGLALAALALLVLVAMAVAMVRPARDSHRT